MISLSSTWRKQTFTLSIWELLTPLVPGQERRRSALRGSRIQTLQGQGQGQGKDLGAVSAFLTRKTSPAQYGNLESSGHGEPVLRSEPGRAWVEDTQSLQRKEVSRCDNYLVSEVLLGKSSLVELEP